MTRVAYVNGRFVPHGQAAVHIEDRGYQLADAVYEVWAVFDGKLEQISPVARSGTFSPKVRTFTAIFSMEGNDPRLMPDLSAAVDVNLGNNSLASNGSR